MQSPQTYGIQKHELKRLYFKKNERICLRSDIAALFDLRQKPISTDLLHVYFRKKMTASSESAPIQFLVIVSKKKFRKAVERNKVKRKVREAIRLSKHRLYEQQVADLQGLQLLVVCKSTNSDIRVTDLMNDLYSVYNKIIQLYILKN